MRLEPETRSGFILTNLTMNLPRNHAVNRRMVRHGGLASVMLLIFGMAMPCGAEAPVGVFARQVMHPDGTKTITTTNLEEKTLEEQVVDGRGKILRRTLYKLDDQQRLAWGRVFGPRNDLRFVDIFKYGGDGRISEIKRYLPDKRLLMVLRYEAGRPSLFDAANNLLPMDRWNAVMK